ncbi:ATP-dependent DNA ligase [Candidatus Woesebacteria bacterium]|nr:MAG: ATP-dependent DNA ligase [Candidatus Woesebacteria bacterium]
MEFKDVSLYLDKLEKTSSRIEITKTLAELIREAGSDEIDKIVYLLLGVLTPSYRSVVFNVAEKMMIEVVAKAYEIDKDTVTAKYKEVGDLGDTAYYYANKRTGKSKLQVNEIYNDLIEIAEDEGEGSQDRKIDSLARLIASLDATSAKFIARIPIGKLRLGFSDKTIIDAISWSISDDKSYSAKLKKAYGVLPDVGLLAKNVKQKGIDETVNNISPELGVPVMPMLAQRIKTTKEMIEKMGEIAIEPKFDGVRVLIHYAKSKDNENPFVRAFTRNLNDVTHMFPELNEIGRYIKAESAIFDTEGVGVDPKTERLVDFQMTMQRRRKHNIGKTALDIPLRFQVFDVVMVNGESLMNLPYEKRRKILGEIIIKNKFIVVDQFTKTQDATFIRKEHKRLIDLGLEGIIVKKLSSKYVAGRTGFRWVKMKEVEDTNGKLSDTVDCVVMGFSRGRGKRANFGVGQFLAGIKKADRFATITKVGTGLSDEQFKTLNEKLKTIVTDKKPKGYVVDKTLEPDFWVTPSLVVELAADEITVSPRHTSGYALRFPRLVRFRYDKTADQVTMLEEIKEIGNL